MQEKSKLLLYPEKEDDDEEGDDDDVDVDNDGDRGKDARRTLSAVNFFQLKPRTAYVSRDCVQPQRDTISR